MFKNIDSDTSIKLNDQRNAWLYLVLRPVWYTQTIPELLLFMLFCYVYYDVYELTLCALSTETPVWQ